MTETKTIYVGSGKKQNETWFKATINPDKIQEHIQEFKGSKFVKLNINLKDTPDQYGKDVSITVDTWTPPEKPNTETTVDNDVPF